jgi:hypothetical protein
MTHAMIMFTDYRTEFAFMSAQVNDDAVRIQ